MQIKTLIHTSACIGALAIPQAIQPLFAQQPNSAPPTELEEVVVTGIRHSLEQSLNTKRDSNEVVDVVSAEEMGKLPDKNIADAVQRLPGVNISKAGAGEGGFSENDRVAIRGTSPSLTQTLINGHTIATGDWFIGDQGGAGSTVGRSVSYALLPSEIADKIVVYKSARADIVEGGVAGAVDIQTRKPLSLKKSLTASVTAQAFYNDIPNKVDPQFNAFLGWKNDSSTFGALGQYFSEERHERRDGQEFLGYGKIQGNPGDPDAALVAAHPDLQGVYYPENINQTLLRHRRIRRGGVADLQWQPSDRLSFDLSGLYSHLYAPNYDTSFLGNPSGFITAGIAPTSYTVRNGVLVAANFPDITAVNTAGGCLLPGGGVNSSNCVTPGLSDKIYRPFSYSETYFGDLTGSFQVTPDAKLSGKLGRSQGIGATPIDQGYEGAWAAGGLNYSLNGTSGLSSISWPAPGQSSGNGPYVSNFNDPNVFMNAAWSPSIKTVDAEKYGQLDLEVAAHRGIWQSTQVGIRLADHERAVHFLAGGTWPHGGPCKTDPTVCLYAKPAWNGETYPGNFQSRLNPASDYSRDFWQIDQNSIYQWMQTYNPTLASRQDWGGDFLIREKTRAAYVMADLGGDRWHGNIGVRAVRTTEHVIWYTLPDSGVCDPTAWARYPVRGGCSADHTVNYYSQNTVDHTFTDILPSSTFKFDFTKQLIGRLAVSRTLSRPDYNTLTPTAQLDDLGLAGGEGNANLKPVRSTNYDLGLEWYYQPRSLLSVGLFYLDLTSYVELDTLHRTEYNSTYQHFSLYNISFPKNVSAHDEGIEVAWQQPLGWGFGTYVNFTLADGKTADGQDVYGASKFTGNAELYWENSAFSARVAYNYRSKYLQGLVLSVPEYDDSVGDVSLSLNYKVTDFLTLTFDGLNLNNPVLKSYGYNRDMPIGRYVNGRQYYLGARLTF